MRFDTNYYDNISGSQLHNIMYGSGIMHGAKNFGTAWANRAMATGKAYYGSPGIDTVKAFIPNFTDSMSQIIPGSNDYNQELYSYLTDSEKATLMADQGFKIMNPLNMIPFIGLFQDTREGAEEMIGMRHPELLKNAINRYNENIKKTAEQIEKNKITKNARDEQERMRIAIKDEIEHMASSSKTNNYNVPTLDLVNTQHIPIDTSRGRGLPIHHLGIRHKVNINY